MIRIDGWFGEGGGRILRTSLSLSLAAAEVGGAEVEGATLGSTAVTFSPGKVRAGDYRFAAGTAGSGTLVFQTYCRRC